MERIAVQKDFGVFEPLHVAYGKDLSDGYADGKDSVQSARENPVARSEPHPFGDVFDHHMLRIFSHRDARCPVFSDIDGEITGFVPRQNHKRTPFLLDHDPHGETAPDNPVVFQRIVVGKILQPELLEIAQKRVSLDPHRFDRRVDIGSGIERLFHRLIFSDVTSTQDEIFFEILDFSVQYVDRIRLHPMALHSFFDTFPQIEIGCLDGGCESGEEISDGGTIEDQNPYDSRQNEERNFSVESIHTRVAGAD